MECPRGEKSKLASETFDGTNHATHGKDTSTVILTSNLEHLLCVSIAKQIELGYIWTLRFDYIHPVLF